jgi:group I intron endonuclease
MTAGIYAIRNLQDGKLYIGSAINIERRWAVHSSQLKCRKHPNAKLQRAFDKHGEHAFVYEVLAMLDESVDREAVVSNRVM